MNEDFYKEIIYSCPIGYAYHKIVFNKKGEPVDYIFLDANTSFEDYTGLSADKILNKRVTKVLPKIHEDTVDWIKEYGTIAQQNTEKEFEGYSKGLGRYYKVKAFSPQKGYFITLFSDISFNKSLEKQVSHEQELVKKYWDTADVLFVIINRDGTVDSINHKGCEILDLNENDIVGKNWFNNFLPKENRAKVKNIFKQVINNQVNNFEFYENAILTSRGETRFISFHNTVLRDDSEHVIGVLSAGNDITEQKKAEAAVRESEDKFRYVFDNSAIGKTITSPDGTIKVNNTFCKMLQYSKDELDGEKWHNITHPDDIDISQQKIENLLNNKSEEEHFEKRYIKKDGDILWAEIHTRLRRDPGQNPLYFITSIIDITAYKKANAAYLESQAIMNAAFDNSQAGIAIADAPDGKLRYVNKAGLLIRNKSEEELVKNIDYHKYVEAWNILHLDGTPYKAEEVPLARAVLYGDTVSEEFIVRRDDFEDRIVLANAGPICDRDHNIIAGIVVFLDITERKNLEKERQILDMHLHQQQRLESIGTLAGGVAHEINNPINGIMNYSQLILDDADSSSNISSYANEIMHETKRITEIVRNLLQFSRNDKQEHSYARIDDIINGTTALIKTVMKQDQINLQIHVPANLPKIKCRSQQIQQVIMNLLTNARDALNEKYSGYDKNKIIKLSCELFEKESRRWLRIYIEDHGNGIPENIQESIFNPFFTTKGRDKGTGLGLSISHGIVKDHHGNLTYDTKTGQYTKFILELPVDNGWDLDAKS